MYSKAEIETLGALKFIGHSCLLGISFFVRNLCLWRFWGWFVVPLGASEIGFAHMLGLSMFVSFLTWKGNTTSDKSSKPLGCSLYIEGVLTSLFVLLFGYITHGFM
jgi:hypothetical protein